MGWRDKYNIEFKGLKEGLHKFDFDIQNSFFEHFEQDLVNVGNLKANITLEKRSLFMKLSFSIKGWVQLTCDRCLENYHQKIECQNNLFVKFGICDSDDDEIIWLSPEEHRINLTQLIYEYIILSIPLKHVHPDKKDGTSGCNPEMLKQIKNHEQTNEKGKIDPRWAALKNWNNN